MSGVDGEISAKHAAVTSHNTGKQKNAARKRSIQPPDFEVWNREKTEQSDWIGMFFLKPPDVNQN
jgi:hypothetical protein